MVFQSKKPSEDNQVLPGGGLEIDLDRRMCSGCRRETPPWEERCRECGADTVPPEEAPAAQFRLPHLEDDEDEFPDDHGDPADHEDPDDHPAPGGHGDPDDHPAPGGHGEPRGHGDPEGREDA
jgi:hypothetical protein